MKTWCIIGRRTECPADNQPPEPCRPAAGRTPVRSGGGESGGMREVLRQEKKYLMTLVDGQRLCDRLSGVMLEDAHNGPQGYAIRSLYFDTLNDGDYHDKMEGLELRRKIRLRIYNPAADFAMLEMKQKEGPYQKKRSLRLNREDAERLILGDCRSLLRYSDSFAAECFGLMQARCYRPKAVVEYRRRAFIAKENQIRITLDSQIVATEASWDIFSPQLLQYPVLDPFNAVLEVKYNGFLLSYIKDLVSAANRSETTQSKYCLARSVGLHYQN